MSTRLRQAYLVALRRARVRSFRATSGLELPYVCFPGDFIGENPFYNRDANRPELIAMWSWCTWEDAPCVFDVGANLGFVATQLAQSLAPVQGRVFAFEVAPYAFGRLREAVKRLGLETSVQPVGCGLSDRSGVVRVTYDERDTMRGKVLAEGIAAQRRVEWSASVTLDGAVESLGVVPTLVKIDVEGHEVRVLRGARRTLAKTTPPALLVEWNPAALAVSGFAPADLAAELEPFACYYVNDFEERGPAFGEPVPDPTRLDWVCNLFCVPPGEESACRWRRARPLALDTLAAKRTDWKRPRTR
jgi:FkbM family methyltransferase